MFPANSSTPVIYEYEYLLLNKWSIDNVNLMLMAPAVFFHSVKLLTWQSCEQYYLQRLHVTIGDITKLMYHNDKFLS